MAQYCNSISSPDEWPSRNVEQVNQEHSAKDGSRNGKIMEDEATRCTLGISYCLQNTDRHDTLLACVRENLTLSRRIRASGALGDPEIQHELSKSRNAQETIAIRAGRMEGQSIP